MKQKMKSIISVLLIILTNYSMSQIFYDSVKNNLQIKIIGKQLPNKNHDTKKRYNSFHTKNHELLEKFRECTYTPRVHVDNNVYILHGLYWNKTLKKDLEFEILERFVNGVIVEKWYITDEDKYAYHLWLGYLNYALFIENGKPVGEEYYYSDKNKSIWNTVKYKYRRNKVKIIIKKEVNEVVNKDNCVIQFYQEWVFR